MYGYNISAHNTYSYWEHTYILLLGVCAYAYTLNACTTVGKVFTGCDYQPTYTIILGVGITMEYVFIQ